MKFLFALALLLLGQGLAYAFPETVRHGYVNCGVCHVSMTGGGTLTPYGRALSAEFMSTWSYEEEGQPLHGAVKLPEGLLVGGGLRSAQTYVETEKVRQGRYFVMQTDVELGWMTETFAVDASFGRDINSLDTDKDDKWVSARHYLMVNLGENMSVRVGKFMKNYGLTLPNHTAQIRRGLGWDEFSETYNAEVNYFTEDYTLTATAIGGRPDDDNEDSETGFALSGQFLHLKPNIRAGGSYFSGRATDKTNREIFGPNFAWGVTDRIYLLGEYNWVRVAPVTGELIDGYVTYTRGGYELVRGLDLTLTHEMKKNDRQDKELSFQGYGPGFSWAPRPHFVLMGEWQKQKTPQFKKLTDTAWLVLQYWL